MRKSKGKGKAWVEKDHTRYGDDYHEICRASHQATGSICCVCLTQATPEKPNRNHHSCYRDEYGLIKDREIPGYHVYSVCEDCHIPICHAPENWNKYDDRSYNCNTEEFIGVLQLGFMIANNQHG